jgi:type II secretory pathway pseudopilin PulG
MSPIRLEDGACMSKTGCVMWGKLELLHSLAKGLFETTTHSLGQPGGRGHDHGGGQDGVTMQRVRTEGGYSAIELAVALALAGIILAGSAFTIRLSMARETIDGWVRTMAYDIASGQQEAVTWRKTVTVTLTSSSYLVAASNGPTTRYAKLPSDISITTTCPSNICSFDRRGMPTAAGTITLTSASTGRTYVVTILSTTGSVSYQ